MSILCDDVSIPFGIDDWLQTNSHYRYLISVNTPVDSTTVLHARYVPLLVKGEYVDIDSYDMPFNEYKYECVSCGSLREEDVAQTVTVAKWIRKKKEEVFNALNGIIVVRERVLDLLNRLPTLQLKIGTVRLDGTNEIDPDLFWIRPAGITGCDARSSVDSRCTKCGEPLHVSFRDSMKILALHEYGLLESDIAFVPAFHKWRESMSPGIRSLVVSGGMFGYLFNHGVRGLVWPDGVYLSLRREPALESERRLREFIPKSGDKAASFVASENQHL